MSGIPAIAIVLARAGSRGLVGKNWAEVAGRACVAWTLDDALAASMVGGVVVSTDAPEVARIAREMNVSHVHVQNILKSMKAADVVSATADPDDGRRTFYELTEKGLELVPKVAQIRDAMGAAVDAIEDETGADLFAAVSLFRQALREKDWKTRVQGNLK